MKIATAFNKILDLIPEISASELGRHAGVNKGQLSAFLKKDGPLAEGKQANLVHCLLQMLDQIKVSVETQRKFTLELLQLREFPPYRIKWGEDDADPFRHVVFGWKRYIERDVEQDVIDYMNNKPFVLGITSGPKTGKSSIAQRVRHVAAKQGVVIYLDCSLFVASGNERLFEWVYQCAKQQLPHEFDHHPSDWDSSVKWLKADVLGEKTVCTFIFDHLENLGDAYDQLTIGWHYVLSQTRDEPSLRKALCVVLAYDPASPVLYTAQARASRLEQDLRIFVPRNYSRGQVERLFMAIFASDASQSAHIALLDDVWAKFQGHPFLTHVYAHTYANSKPSAALEAAQAAVQSAFKNHIAPILLSNSYKKSLAQHFSSIPDMQGEESTCIKVDGTHSVLLHDTGLFFEHGYAEKSRLSCTPWIYARLLEAFRVGVNDEHSAQ